MVTVETKRFRTNDFVRNVDSSIPERVVQHVAKIIQSLVADIPGEKRHDVNVPLWLRKERAIETRVPHGPLDTFPG
jgi:hypothetical protein